MANVSQSGLVTASSAGTATITATAQDGSGVSASYTVTVQAFPVTVIPVIGIQLLPQTMELKIGDMLSIAAIVSPTNAANKP